MKDVERFTAELERPIGQSAGAPTTDADLEADAQAFMAFAKAMGVRDPTNAVVDDDVPLPSTSGAESAAVES